LDFIVNYLQQEKKNFFLENIEEGLKMISFLSPEDQSIYLKKFINSDDDIIQENAANIIIKNNREELIQECLNCNNLSVLKTIIK